MEIEAKVAQFIQNRQLMTKDGKYLLGLSGGSDSVALFRMLQSLGFHFHAVHCNFHLRGEESDRDENFCVDLCRKFKVELHRIHFDTTTYASLHQVSIEMAARELRYRYFEKLRQDLSIDDIVIAHHQDDQVETILLNIVRGTGLRGLMGIHPRNGHIVRPMLEVTRKEILHYLQSIGQDYVTDSTNLTNEARRNVIRHEVVPVLRQLNPSIGDTLSALARRMSEVSQFLVPRMEQLIEEAKIDTDQYDMEKILQNSTPQLILWHLLGDEGFNGDQIKEIILSASDKRTEGSGSGKIWKGRDRVATLSHGRLLLQSKDTWEQAMPAFRIPETGNYVYNEYGKFKVEIEDFRSSDQISKEPLSATFDADTVRFPLIIRPCREGDRFKPFGMKGTKLVSDFLTDRHFSIFDKHRQLVVTDADGQIIWLAGLRTDARFAVVAGKTRRLLRIKWTASHQ